jgi:hypothetical protein
MTCTRRALIHAIGQCATCGKEWGWYLTAQRNARQHARRTGHYVTVELGYSVHYNKPGSKGGLMTGR